MGIDYLYLEALQHVSRADVRRAVVEEMSAEGWRLAAHESGEIEIEIAERGKWTVVQDVRQKLPTEWAERLAHSLGVVGISARSWSDEGVLTIFRFDGDRPNGRLSFEEGKPSRRLSVSFLADLASTKNQPALRKGVEPAGRRCDDVLEEILKLAGLPAAFTRYMYETGGTMLRFARPLRPVPKSKTPAVRVRNVRFEVSFHVRDVAPSAVVDAISQALIKTGLRESSGSNPARQIFVRDWHGWTSFGEVVLRGDPLDWGKLLSRALATPVLSVVVGDTAAELSVFVRARAAARSAVFSTSEQFVADPGLLAAFGVKKKVRLKLPYNPFLGVNDHRAALDAVGAALGLENPVLAGKIKGRVLAFE